MKFVVVLLSIRDEVERRLEALNLDDAQVYSALAEMNDLLLDKLDQLKEIE